MASSRRHKATLIYHSKVNVIHKRTDEVAIAELKVWEVPESDDFPEGLKYSAFLVAKESGRVIVGFDNHKPKGPHLHQGDEEILYDFRGTDELIDDFWSLVSKEGFLI